MQKANSVTDAVEEASFSIPIGFALFEDFPFTFRDYLATRVRYRNLFDMMVDAKIGSMAIMGHGNIWVIVAETGWPSSGIDAGEVDVTFLYSEMFLKALLTYLRSGSGKKLFQRFISLSLLRKMPSKGLGIGDFCIIT
ncbi:Glucan endo-1,3-beta-glucosidase 2 [Cardamine amara subsp. amara]|uniref:glucan endo-1,3-beta-D-glucosidase n=1 Tax=Cardamine amara subsp. amara TaxID=228776 RepID=A0ABD0ZQ30_CARAN